MIGPVIQSIGVPELQSNRVSALLVSLVESPGPLRARVENTLKDAIHSGQLRAGERLPPSRVLAADLGCSRWVITEAYSQLAAEGYVESQVGAGTRVSATAVIHPPADAQPSTDPPESGLLDLRPGIPDLREFPRARWQRHIQQVLRSTAMENLHYPDVAGSPALRATLAGYLRRVRGLGVSADQVVVTLGSTHSVSVIVRALIARATLRRGITMAVEDPGWPRLPEVAAAAGARIVNVPVDADGILTNRLNESRPDVVLTSPSHQFPVGAVLALERRRQLIKWARTATDRANTSARRLVIEDAPDRLVIEDDYDAEYRYDRRPTGALASLDPSAVCYLGSVSKTLVPALRLGWMVPPEHLRESVLAVIRDTGSAPPGLDQLTLASFIDSGDYDRHLRRQRKIYRERRDLLVRRLTAEVPDLPISGAAAGLHLVRSHDIAEVRAPPDSSSATARFVSVRFRTPSHGSEKHSRDPCEITRLAGSNRDKLSLACSERNVSSFVQRNNGTHDVAVFDHCADYLGAGTRAELGGEMSADPVPRRSWLDQRRDEPWVPVLSPRLANALALILCTLIAIGLTVWAAA